MTPCSSPVRSIPGPKGSDGDPCVPCDDGVSAFTVLTAPFTVPAVGATAVAAVVDSVWVAIGEPLYLQNGGTFYVTATTNSTHVTLRNPAAETGNVAAGTVIPVASKLSPSGFKGAIGTSGAPGTGVTVATKGDIQTYAGAPANLGVGTPGQILRALPAAGTGLDWEQLIPNATAAADDNKIAVANCPVGTETPAALQFMPARVTDTGAFQNVGGNAKGVDATEMQPARAAANQVASGNNSTISGGRNNMSSAQGSTVVGGEGCIASGADSVAGGSVCTASGQSSVALGQSSTASGSNSTAIGLNSQATAANCLALGSSASATNNNDIAFGTSAAASGSGSVAMSTLAVASGQFSVAIGNQNEATAQYASSFGGLGNQAFGSGSCIAGGLQAVADKYGQHAHASGTFFDGGDAQTSELIWRVSTTDATANVEMFLDGSGASQRATVPADTTWAFHIIAVARRDNGESITFDVQGGIQNNGGATALVAAVVASVIADGTGTALTIANFTVDADNGNDSLRIRVQGIAAQNWRWVAHARLVEVHFTV